MTRLFSFLSVILVLFLSACSQEPEPAAPEEMESAASVPAAPANDNISGRVSSSAGPEAGVWVIAETNDLGTPYAKIVVTNDNGEYLIPDLPEASYELWVRGYGLVDSEHINVTPGSSTDLTAVLAPNARAAAQYYPAGYWYSMLEIPDASEFPGTGPQGNGINPNITHQEDFIRQVGNGGCLACHQLGNAAIREIPAMFSDLTSVDAWQRRIQSGQAGGNMVRGMSGLGMEAFNEMYAGWTERIAQGALPPAPERPQGMERNVVITIWDWADPQAYMHDLVSTDRRDPTLNANGLIYGATELSTDYIPVLDPVNHTIEQIPLSMLDPGAPSVSGSQLAESPYWGTEEPWDSQTNVHNPMMDQDGRVWLTARVRGPENPAWCQEGSEHPSAQVFPLQGSGRHLGVYDPATDEYTPIDTCFSTHHLMFAEDADNTLWTSGGGPAVGWLNTRQFLETGDAAAAQGWTPMILDTNGNGQRDAFTEPGEPMNPQMDTRIMNGSFYAVAPAPDGSVWGTMLGYPGAVARLVPGDNPNTDALVEYYELPLDENGNAIEGFSPRGGDVDRNGVMWVALASGQMASFDRSLCTGPLNGPEATGQHCPEGWSFYTEPLPQYQGLDRPGSAEGSYYTWVDQRGALGLGENTPINTGNQSGALLVLDNGEWIRMRVPYPLGFYTKWMDGRIDDPDGGWKGRGIWATFSSRTPFHMETGTGTTSKVYKFQLRPDPLSD
tara:strand:- start:63962 stop:66139 length:2178 start_codon:yes stop_codon:yes gene_type:complete